MKIGLFFGSFNPVHIGHLAIANYMVEFTDIDELWFVISPQNPLKRKSSLLTDSYRYEILEKAIGHQGKFRISDVEFNMPKPSYTIDTLTYLSERNPNIEFILIMGSDGLQTFHKWKNYQEIIRHYTRYVYPRPGSGHNEVKKSENIKLIKAPQIEISSSFIRNAIKENKDIRYFLPAGVFEYIDKMGFYR
ncbi:MAG: nicotinate-nucleotide adenylyltransferase [Bacteroidales bacterium]|nr:nicotinate-nucleotide adenylyltransferase [Bacteroidales bacterium]